MSHSIYGWRSSTGYPWRNTFPNPFCDYASTYIPETINEAMEWSEQVFLSNGTYSSAIDRILSYFITKTEVFGEDVGEDERQEWDNFLEDDLNISMIQRAIGRDLLCYGNALVSVLFPFRRYLSCASCSLFDAPYDVLYKSKKVNLKWDNFQFVGTCPVCGHRGPMLRQDRRTKEKRRIVVKRWNPKQFKILHSPVTDRCEYVWVIPKSIRDDIKAGKPHVLRDTPWEIVEAVSKEGNLHFNDDEIYHLREEPLSGQELRGWGLSRVVQNTRQAWYVQMLHRQNEEIVSDYLSPLRVISPPVGQSGEVDSWLMNGGINGFVLGVNSILQHRRVDRDGWYISPTPLQYQVLGGEAKNLAPHELLDQGNAKLLNDIGFPVELYSFSLSSQATVPALRLLESVWGHLVFGLNRVTQWIVDRIAREMNWCQIKVRMARITVVDDIQGRMLLQQLAMAKVVSQSEALKPFNLDFKDEFRKILEEDRFMQQQQQKVQKEMEQSSVSQVLAPSPLEKMLSQPPPGAAPAGPGGMPAGAPAGAAPPGTSPMTAIQPGSTPQEIEANAQMLADQLLPLSYSERHSQLAEIRKADPVLHSRVIKILEQKRREIRNQGGNMLMQQQYGVKM